MYLAVALITLFFTQPAAAAGWWDDFTNNLATDLAPFIALLGERPAQQFLSESTSIWDYLIFAVAPLGIVTTIVSTIRVGGGPSLRAFIGRAQEGQRQVEAELCSSTSEDVCELYNNGGIARVFGNPKILEVVVDHEGEDYDDKAERLKLPDRVQVGCLLTEAKSGIYTFRDYERVTRNSNEREWRYKAPGWFTLRVRTWWHQLRKRFSPLHDTAPSIQEEPEYAPNPNLTLNIWMRQRSTVFLQIVAATGIAIQSGVVLAALVITYYFQLEKDDGPAAPYAAPLMGIGTVFLTVGAFLSAYIIGEATHESKFERSQTPKSELIVLQPGGQVIGDQHFEAFAYNDHGATRTYISSSKLRQIKRGDSSVILSIALTAGGFILQFVGLRGLHSSVAIAQLGATILMSGIRASLRTQRLSSSRNLLQGVSAEGHELDWLALYIGGRDVPGNGPEGALKTDGTPPGSPSGGTSPPDDVESKARSKAPPVSLPRERSNASYTPGDQGESGVSCEGTSEVTTWLPFWRRWFRRRKKVVSTRRVPRSIMFFGMARETPQAFLFPQWPPTDPAKHPHLSTRPVITGSLTEPGFKDEDTPSMRVSTAQKIVAYRARLARLTRDQQPKVMTKESPNSETTLYQTTEVETRPKCMLGWGDDLVVVRDTSRRLASAITELADIIFSNDFQLRGSWRYATSFRWPISCVVSDELQGGDEPDTVYLTLRRSNARTQWTLDPAHVEAVLGLWLWSLKRDTSFAANTSPQGDRLRNERIVSDYSGITLGFLPPGFDDRSISIADYNEIGTTHKISDVRNVWARSQLKRTSPYHLSNPRERHTAGGHARLFGWSSISESYLFSNSEANVLVAPADDDLHLLLAQEILGCFLCATSSIVSHVGGEMRIVDDEKKGEWLENTVIEKMRRCCIRHELGSVADDTAYCILGGLLSHQGLLHESALRYQKRTSPSFLDQRPEMRLREGDGRIALQLNPKGLDILGDFTRNIVEGNFIGVQSYVAYLFKELKQGEARHKGDNGGRVDTKVLAKGVTASHLVATLTAYEKLRKSQSRGPGRFDPYRLDLVIEMMADLCDAEELAQDDSDEHYPVEGLNLMEWELHRRHVRGKPPTTSPINLAAYLGLRAPLMALLRRIWREPAYGKYMLRALCIAAHRGDNEMVEELAANLDHLTGITLTEALVDAALENNLACVHTLAATGLCTQEYFRNYHGLWGPMDALWYPVQARLTVQGEVERGKWVKGVEEAELEWT